MVRAGVGATGSIMPLIVHTKRDEAWQMKARCMPRCRIQASKNNHLNTASLVVPPNMCMQPTAFGARDRGDFSAVLYRAPKAAADASRSAASASQTPAGKIVDIFNLNVILQLPNVMNSIEFGYEPINTSLQQLWLVKHSCSAILRGMRK
jgi:hypothetical protein